MGGRRERGAGRTQWGEEEGEEVNEHSGGRKRARR